MRLCKAFACWVLLGFLPTVSFALGMGDIKLESALNEPFAAEVSLEALGNAKLSEIKVTLATADTFDRYGLDRPLFLSDFRFRVEENAAGQPVVRITSASAVAEPFVTLLLDVKWGSGRLLREYTVLLDPPLFEDTTVQPAMTPAETQAPVESLPAERATAESAVAESSAAETAIADSSPQAALLEPVMEPRPAAAGVAELAPEEVAEPEPMAPEPMALEEEPTPQVADAPPASTPPAISSAALDGDYTTSNGDTLWSIASRSRDQRVSTNQMMLAIYRANPEAFLGNINAMKANANLRLPGAEDARYLSPRQATAEAIEQHAAWRGAGAGSSGTIVETREAAVETEADAAAVETEADAAAVETEAAIAEIETEAAIEGQLELVAPTETDTAEDADGFAAADEQMGAGVGEFDADVEESGRLLQVEDAELEALQDRISDLEQEPLGIDEIGDEVVEGDTQIVVEGLDEPLESPFADEAELLEDDSLGTGDLAADEDAGQVEITAVEEARPGEVAELAEDDSASLIGELLSSYWLWAAGGLALLVALFLARRRVGGADAGATGTWEPDEDIPHDETLKDFSDLPAFDDASIVVDEVDDTLAEDAAPAAPVQEPEPEPEPEPIFDEAADASIRDAFDEGAAAEIDEPQVQPPVQPEPQVEQAKDVVDDVVDLDDFDIDEPTTDLAELSAADAAAGPDDELETPLEKTISTGAPLNLDQADPIAEAEFHMAYGLYDQAANLLVKALDEEPDNRDYRVKLIEVYFVWENQDGFLAQATELHGAISDDSDADWNKVLILGKQLCPDDALFSGAAASSPAADAMDLELGEDAGEMDLDLSLGGTEVQAWEIAQLADEDGGLDFNMDAEGDGAGDDLSLDLGGEEDSPDDGSAFALDLGADDELAATAESPTVDSLGSEAPTVEADMGAATMESPTIENPMVGGDAEPPELDIDLEATDAGSTMESPTLQLPDSNSDTSEMPALEASPDDAAALDDPTALDVDLSGLADFAEEGGESIDSGESIGDEDATVLARTGDISDLESAMAGDTVQQPQIESAAEGDTAEQPEIAVDDLPDMGESASGDASTGEATMTEVGTKLDLARAYVDMGDPEGARSILNEVVEEGSDSQQQEARQLLAELGD